jgi:hypothetical protein
MDVFAALADFSARASVPFIVIGGHAVIAHGYPRLTADIDIAIPEDDLPKWARWLAEHGYQPRPRTTAFQQFSAPPGTDWPIDLMLLDRPTFDKLWSGSSPADFGSAALPIPDPQHLIAMKLHALRHGPRKRKYKDLTDVIEIMRRRAIQPDDARFRASIQRYATPEIESEIRRSLGA